MFPANLEHANSTGRLDLFALYGPIVNYHSVDYCFCVKCTPTAKDQLKKAIVTEKQNQLRKAGLNPMQLMQATVSAAATAGGVNP